MNLRLRDISLPLVVVLFVAAMWLNIRDTPKGLDLSWQDTTGIDEASLFRETYQWLVVGKPASEREFPGYPPIALFVQYLGYQVVLATGSPEYSYAIQTIDLVRQWSVLPTMLTALVLYMATASFFSKRVGLLAMFAWLLSWWMQSARATALTESWLMLFVALTLWGTVEALKRRSFMAAVLATGAALLAITAKYPVFPLLGLPVGATLWLSLRSVRTGAAVLFIQALMIAAVAALLLIAYDGSTLMGKSEPANFLSGGTATFRTLDYLLLMVETVVRQAGVASVLGLILVTIGLGTAILRMHWWQRRLTGLMLIVILSQIIVTLLYIRFWGLAGRYIAPVAVLSIPLVAASLEALVWLTVQGMMRLRPLSNPQRWQLALFMPVAILFVIGISGQRLMYLGQPALPRVETALIRWVPQTLTDGTLLLPADSASRFFLFDQRYSGPTRLPVPPWYQSALEERTLAGWQQDYVRYALLSDTDLERLNTTETGRELLAAATLLRHFETTPDAPWSGSPLSVYALSTIEDVRDLSFDNGLTLRGFTPSPNQLQVGQTMTILPWWHLSQPASEELSLFVHLTRANDEQIISQYDLPLSTATYPVTGWEVADDSIQGNPITITLPDDLPAGQYVLSAGVYSVASGQRLRLASGDDAFTLTEFTVNNE